MNKAKNIVHHKGERPKCDVFFEVTSQRIYNEANWKGLVFKALITDAVILHKLQIVLDMHKEQTTPFEDVMRGARGEGAFSRPKYYEVEGGIEVIFECFGNPMDADNLAEAFEQYIYRVPSLDMCIG